MIKPTYRSVRVALCLASATWLSGLTVCVQSSAADPPRLAGGTRIQTLSEWIELQGSEFNTVAPDESTVDTSDSKLVTVSFEPEPVKLRAPQVQPRGVTTAGTAGVSKSALSAETVRRLLSNARMAAAAGDLTQAQLLAETAAEMPIPLELFEKFPQRILNEIAFMTARKRNIIRTAWNQESSANPDVSSRSDYDEPVPGEGPLADAELDHQFRSPQLKRSTEDTSCPQIVNTKPTMVDEDGNKLVLPPGFKRPDDPAAGRDHRSDWKALSYAWAAPVARHQPLYFEDPELERYGNEFCFVQPVVSATRFYLTFATLPYQTSIPNNAWFDVKYDLGYERPGNCVPYSIHILPLDLTAGVSASCIITGIALALMTP